MFLSRYVVVPSGPEADDQLIVLDPHAADPDDDTAGDEGLAGSSG